jgi:hypothetical protein
VRSLCSQRNSQSQFSRPLRDQIGLNAIETTYRECQAEERETAEESGDEPFAAEAIAFQQIGCRSQVAYRLTWINAMHVLLDGVEQTGGVATGALKGDRAWLPYLHFDIAYKVTLLVT